MLPAISRQLMRYSPANSAFLDVTAQTSCGCVTSRHNKKHGQNFINHTLVENPRVPLLNCPAIRHDILEFCARVLVTPPGQTVRGALAWYFGRAGRIGKTVADSLLFRSALHQGRSDASYIYCLSEPTLQRGSPSSAGHFQEKWTGYGQLARKNGENSRTKLQNVVADSTVNL